MLVCTNVSMVTRISVLNLLSKTLSKVFCCIRPEFYSEVDNGITGDEHNFSINVSEDLRAARSANIEYSARPDNRLPGCIAVHLVEPNLDGPECKAQIEQGLQGLKSGVDT